MQNCVSSACRTVSFFKVKALHSDVMELLLNCLVGKKITLNKTPIFATCIFYLCSEMHSCDNVSTNLPNISIITNMQHSAI